MYKPIQRLTPFSQFIQQLESWEPFLHKFLVSPAFQKIYDFLKIQYQNKIIYPSPQQIFFAFKSTPFQQLKVVIIGQDPYHQPNQAHGLCFSVKKPTPPPPSLKNIFKNLQQDQNINFKIPTHGQLTKWANQGILLLNSVLTVQFDKANSHKQCGWQKFTDQVVKIINKQCKNIVFLLWGLYAQKKVKNLDKLKHFVLTTSHPSPLSAHNGFLQSSIKQQQECFSQCNKILKEIGKQPIDWNLD